MLTFYAVILVIAIFIIRYVIKYVAYKGVDTIGNAIKKKQNEENPDNTEDLANRYRH